MALERGSPPVDYCTSASQRAANHRGAEGSVHFDSHFSCQHSNKPDINLQVAKNPKSRLYFINLVRAYRVKVNSA